MGFKKTLANVALVTAACVGALGIGALAVKFNDAVHPASQGQQYLVKKGYTHVEGGDVSIFNTCGKNVFARKYEVTNAASGQREQRTVCFSPLFGPHGPLIGK